jgi:predicted RNase H-like nuclease (RuvC/YqgF family)
MSLELQTALVTAIAAVLGGLIGARARTVNEISEAAHRLLKPLNTRIATLEANYKKLRTDYDQLEREVGRFKDVIRMLYRGIEALLHQLHDACITPSWTPPPLEELLDGDGGKNGERH